MKEKKYVELFQSANQQHKEIVKIQRVQFQHNGHDMHDTKAQHNKF